MFALGLQNERQDNSLAVMKKYIVYTNHMWLAAKFSTAEKADKEFRGVQNGSSLKNAPFGRLEWLLLCRTSNCHPSSVKSPLLMPAARKELQ